jgi:hypothetical protein
MSVEIAGGIANKLNGNKIIDINNLSPVDIKYVMLGLGMKVFTKPYDMTLGGVRTKDNRSGKFNDWLFMIYHDEKGALQGIIEKGTTDAGLYYREHPMTTKGTCIIAHTKQYMGAFTYMEKGAHRGQEGFRQTGPLDYFLDNNKDKYLDFVNLILNQIYNTNGHNMGTVGEDVHNWSAGCWGSIIKIMRKFYDLARAQIKHGHGPKLSYAMLHETDFV